MVVYFKNIWIYIISSGAFEKNEFELLYKLDFDMEETFRGDAQNKLLFADAYSEDNIYDFVCFSGDDAMHAWHVDVHLENKKKKILELATKIKENNCFSILNINNEIKEMMH